MGAGLPPPPPGCPPTLGVYRTANPRERVLVLGVVFAVFAAFAFWEHAQSGLAWPWAAGIFGSAFVLVGVSVVRGEVSSGPNWLRRVAPLGTAWVRTDQLVEAAVETSLTGSRVLLRDSSGRRVHARLEEIAESPDVWRPFSAALSASLASGRLRVDAAARHALGLPSPVANVK